MGSLRARLSWCLAEGVRPMSRIWTAALVAGVLAAVPLHGLGAEQGGSPGAEEPADRQRASRVEGDGAARGEGGGAAGSGVLDAEMIEAQRRLQELQKRLGEIQQETFEASEQLQERQQRLEQRAMAKMEELGYEARRHHKRMEEIYERFEAGDLSQQERQRLAEAFQRAQKELQQAQQEAMQDEAFSKSMGPDMRAFQQDLLAAMKERHPETKELMEELEELQSVVRGRMQRGRSEEARLEGEGASLPQGATPE